MILAQDVYEAITGDVDGWQASAASAAQDLLEDALGRRGKLELDDRTEQCRYKGDGTIYPEAVPIVSVDGGLQFFDDVVYGATPDASVFVGFFPPVDPAVVTLTYRGGFDASTVPGYMLYDLAWATYALSRPALALAAVSVPAGATSASSGDVSVSFPAGGSASNSPAGWVVRWSPITLRHRRRSP